MNVLVDTSVWCLALRRKTASLNAPEKVIVAELSELVREGRARLIGLVRQELLSGIKTTEQFEKLRLHLRSFPDEPIDTSDHEEAAKAGNRCRGNVIVVSIIDILTLCGSDQTRVGNLYDCPGFYKLDECAVHLDPRDTEVALRFGAVGYEQEGAKFPPAFSLMSRRRKVRQNRLINSIIADHISANAVPAPVHRHPHLVSTCEIDAVRHIAHSGTSGNQGRAFIDRAIPDLASLKLK